MPDHSIDVAAEPARYADRLKFSGHAARQPPTLNMLPAPNLNCRGDVPSTASLSMSLEVQQQALPGRWRLAQARAARAAAMEVGPAREEAGTGAGAGPERTGAAPRRRRSISAPRARERCDQPCGQPAAASVAAPAGRCGVVSTLGEEARCHAAVVPPISRATTPHLVVRRNESYAALPPESAAVLNKLDHSLQQLCGGADQGRSGGGSGACFHPSPAEVGGWAERTGIATRRRRSMSAPRERTTPLAPITQPLVRRAKSPWPLPPPQGVSSGWRAGIGGHCSRLAPSLADDEEPPTARQAKSRLPPSFPSCASSGGGDGSGDDEARREAQPPPGPGAAVRCASTAFPSSPMHGASLPPASLSMSLEVQQQALPGRWRLAQARAARRDQQCGQGNLEAETVQLPGVEGLAAPRRPRPRRS